MSNRPKEFTQALRNLRSLAVNDERTMVSYDAVEDYVAERENKVVDAERRVVDAERRVVDAENRAAETERARAKASYGLAQLNARHLLEELAAKFVTYHHSNAKGCNFLSPSKKASTTAILTHMPNCPSKGVCFEAICSASGKIDREKFGTSVAAAGRLFQNQSDSLHSKVTVVELGTIYLPADLISEKVDMLAIIAASLNLRVKYFLSDREVAVDEIPSRIVELASDASSQSSRDSESKKAPKKKRRTN